MLRDEDLTRFCGGDVIQQQVLFEDRAIGSRCIRFGQLVLAQSQMFRVFQLGVQMFVVEFFLLGVEQRDLGCREFVEQRLARKWTAPNTQNASLI